MFFTALGTLFTSGGELHSDDALGRLENWLCDDTLIIALKSMYIMRQLTQTFPSFGIKLPGHVMPACTLSSNIKVKLSKSM